ncbi:MAG: hypothetical protein SX243_17510 [Acidobacteriota bacterium]|nr:hypothetical protein [Acidobacteriota bacterium]
MSRELAFGFSSVLEARGLEGVRPSPRDEGGSEGSERRIAGGVGAKKVDVTWATEESGLLLAFSIKTINFRDRRSGHFQKNLTNRRGDMLFEAVTLHRRFPYAVLGGFFMFDAAAETDGTDRRRSTFLNAHDRFRIFTGRVDPAGRDEQFEGLYIGLVGADPDGSSVRFFEAGKPDQEIQLSQAVNHLVSMVADRNPDFYQFGEGRLEKI